MHRFLLLLLWALTQHSAFATVYKCEQDGKVAYQASPCTNGSDISRKVNQPAPSVAVTTTASNPTHKQRSCVGKELTISFRDMPIRMTLAVLADFAGHKLIADPSITGSAAFHYPCTEWDVVLQDIAKRHNLVVKVENRTIFATKR
jgi:hypothetical protein